MNVSPDKVHFRGSRNPRDASKRLKCSCQSENEGGVLREGDERRATLDLSETAGRPYMQVGSD